MVKDLTNSKVVKQNIINNEFALTEIEQPVGLKDIFLKKR